MDYDDDVKFSKKQKGKRVISKSGEPANSGGMCCAGESNNCLIF